MGLVNIGTGHHGFLNDVTVKNFIVSDGIILVHRCNDCKISDNTITGGKIQMQIGTNTLISDNIIKPRGDYGIELGGNTDAPLGPNNVVRNNLIDRENLSFYDTGYLYIGNGISIMGDGVTVTGNTVRNNVEGMRSELTNGRGIVVDGQNNNISNNVVSSNQIGIAIISEFIPDSPPYQSNIISGNTVSDNIKYGIYLDIDSSGYTLSGNTVSGNGLSNIKGLPETCFSAAGIFCTLDV